MTDSAEEDFSQIKSRLILSPVLASPDFSKPFTIRCDTSEFDLVAVLTQDEKDDEHAIAFASRMLNSVENNYSVT